MTITGVIAEYNPFHNGHKYQFEQIKKSGSDYIVVVLSGNFTQRGEPAIVNKYTRTRMALSEGADLVIELPTVYATSTSKFFALGGVSLLNNLGIIDNIAFGVEAGGSATVEKVASFLLNPPALYDSTLDSKMREGLTYPAARQAALSLFFDKDELACIDKPNTILAIEYCHTIKKLDSKITPFPIIRKGDDYNDNSVHTQGFCSAMAIRNEIRNSCTKAILHNNMPPASASIMSDAHPIYSNDFSDMLHYKLLTSDNFDKYLDVYPAFGARIKDRLSEYTDFDSFCNLLKTKNTTYTSVSRMLTHILLDITATLPSSVPYARILGFRKSSEAVLTQIKENSSIPLISKLADYPSNPILDIDIKASDIYNAAVLHKYGIREKNDYSQGIVIQ
ncbi:MAG: nucleotidyltransferase family protein [Lachnospiraceae bacterium]|nr:nucleotidyltransferase family protein [Candidatus Colinaster equi]